MPPASRNNASFLRRCAVCAVIFAWGTCSALAQEPSPPPDADAAPLPEAPVAVADPGPLKVMTWNVGTSPYAIAMRKIKSEAPSWRTSFGAQRRTIKAPDTPHASDFDVDIVLLQGVINPRALRRLFPARRWRLVLSPRALSVLPKGSVFTAPVSTTEVEAVAVRYRRGLRITTMSEVAEPATPALDAAAGAAPASAPGLAVKVLDRGRTLWFASVDLGVSCASADGPCGAWDQMTKWRLARRHSGETVVLGGRLKLGPQTGLCEALSIEADLAPPAPLTAQGENRDLLGCAAELTLE